MLAWLLLLPSPPMDLYTNPQPPLRCCPNPSYFRTDLLRTAGTGKGTTSICFLSHFTSPTGPLSPCSVCSLILNCLNSSLCSALKTFYSHEPYLHPCPSLSTKEQRPHHPSLTAVLFPFLTQESGMEAPGQL